MSSLQPPGGRKGLATWVLDTCLAVLGGALALTAAVWLLQSIWPALAMVGGCVTGIAAMWVGIRWWLSRW